MPNLPLSKKRERWVQSHKPADMVGTRLAYNASQQSKYKAALEKLVSRMADKTTKEILKLFESSTALEFRAKELAVGMDADIASQARILTNGLKKKFDLLFNRKSKVLAVNMIRGANSTSKNSLKRSLKQLSGGLTIKTSAIPNTLKTILKGALTENVSLIKSISTKYHEQVQQTVMRSIMYGGGLERAVPRLQEQLLTEGKQATKLARIERQLAKVEEEDPRRDQLEEQLEKIKEQAQRRAKNIALDQTRKVFNSINLERMKQLGIEDFKWIHSGGGQRPRKDHVEMNGNVYSISDPPVINKKTGTRGFPGQEPNCKCSMSPVVRLKGTV